MRPKSLSIIIAGIIICAFGCKKDIANKPKTLSSTSADVYVAGTVIAANGNFVAAYWKNGALVKLSDSSSAASANGIAVHGQDVYVVGTMGVPTNPAATNAVYWKNGVATILNSNGLINSDPYAIAFQGNDMYIVGRANNNTYPSTAMYWKNGVAITLPDASGNSIARAIAVNGTDVYIAGYNSSGIVYWKNGGSPSVSAPPSSSSFDVSSIAVNGTDVYVAGSLNNTAAYWKNGVATVTANGGTVTGIATNGTDLLMAGTVITGVGSGGFATFWKNNIPAQLSQGTSFASAICSNGQDVYVAGGTYSVNPNNGTDQNMVLYYWKNGVPVALSTGGGINSDVSSMVVVPN